MEIDGVTTNVRTVNSCHGTFPSDVVNIDGIIPTTGGDDVRVERIESYAENAVRVTREVAIALHGENHRFGLLIVQSEQSILTNGS